MALADLLLPVTVGTTLSSCRGGTGGLTELTWLKRWESNHGLAAEAVAGCTG